MGEIMNCRNCLEWYSTALWRGNCRKHPWEKDRWSEHAEPNEDCQGKDYVDKYIKYQKEELCKR
jgi:hypothetical protein